MITSSYRLLLEYEESKYNKSKAAEGRRVDSRKQAGTEKEKGKFNCKVAPSLTHRLTESATEEIKMFNS